MGRSTSYLYSMPRETYSKLCQEKIYSYGKTAVNIYVPSSNYTTRKNIKNDTIYYAKHQDFCRETLSENIENVYKYLYMRNNRELSFGAIKYILRNNSKDYIALKNDKEKELLFNNLYNSLVLSNNFIFIRDLGSYISIDYIDIPSVPIVSLFSFIMRDCIKYLINTKKADNSKLIKYILSGEPFTESYSEDSNLNKYYINFYSFYYAFGLYLFYNYRYMFGRSTKHTANGVCTYILDQMVIIKEYPKRMLEFIKEFKIPDSLTNDLSATMEMSKNIGIKKELEALGNFYIIRDGKEYGKY